MPTEPRPESELTGNAAVDDPQPTRRPLLSRRTAVRFVVILGVVSLFADFTYEGARSIAGPFLATLGASGLIVGATSGGGELAGYAVRLVSGRTADRTGQMWSLTIAGYAVNLVAVPLLALAGNWPIAVALLVAERIGKGVRVPPRDAMLSYATEQTGHGWGFGLHEALDQIGAIAGPLLVAAVLALRHRDYPAAFAVLAIPAACALVVLMVARAQYPRPQRLARREPSPGPATPLPQTFWWYLAAVALFAAGFADFPLIAFHFEHTSLLSAGAVPLLYALAMAVDAAAALVLGRLFDRSGLIVLGGAALVAAFFAPLAFSTNVTAAVIGVMLWGIGMGSQESIIRANVAKLVADRRASAYGVFNAIFGIAWFGGSVLIGALYDWSRLALVIFSVTVQLLALPLLLEVHRSARAAASGV